MKVNNIIYQNGIQTKLSSSHLVGNHVTVLSCRPIEWHYTKQQKLSSVRSTLGQRPWRWPSVDLTLAKRRMPDNWLHSSTCWFGGSVLGMARVIATCVVRGVQSCRKTTEYLQSPTLYLSISDLECRSYSCQVASCRRDIRVVQISYSFLWVKIRLQLNNLGPKGLLGDRA